MQAARPSLANPLERAIPMKAVVCRAFGSPNDLTLEDATAKEPGGGEIRIAIRAASVNFFDVLMVQGLYQRKPPFPFVAGTDCAGTVIEVGSDVTTIKPGDRVMAFNWSGGAFAQEMTVHQQNVFKIPKSVEFPAAAALKSVYGTALYGLRNRGRLKAGDNLLVLGASGGVGIAFVEIGKLLGATVIAAVSTDEKAQRLQKYEVRTLTYSSNSLREQVRALTGGRGADVIVDPVGGDLFDDAVRSIAWDGRLCVVGFASGRISQVQASQVLLKSFDVVGVNYGGWVDREVAAHRAETEELIEWCADGKIAPLVSQTLPMAEVATAMRLIQDRSVVGKIVLSTD